MMDDRTAKARLRDAALEIVATSGSKALTARAVAEKAGLSAGLIRHHFGSMAGLLKACDQYVAALIRESKIDAIHAGLGIDFLAALRAYDSPAMSYLANRLTESSDTLDDLVDEIYDNAIAYIQQGVDMGLFTASNTPQMRAGIFVLMGLGSLALNHHSKRLIGIDFTAQDFADQPRVFEYITAILDIFTDGTFTPQAAAAYRAAVNPLSGNST